MEVNWFILGIAAFCTAIILAYLIWKNWKDEKEVIQSFNDEIIPEKHESDDDEI